MTVAALQLDSVSATFGGVRAVDQVSLQVGQGERRGIIGPNGAGKTTLFNIISGWVTPSHGAVRLHDEVVTAMAPDRLARKGLTRTFQRTQLCGSLSVRENIELAVQVRERIINRMWRPASRLSGVRAAADEVLDELGLTKYGDLPARALSYGVQRQVEVATALATRPTVLLLDEPTSGLSPAETREMSEFLQRLASDMTILIVEHDMEVLFGIANRVLVMDRGVVLADGSPAEIKADLRVRAAYMGDHHGGDES